jgi:hypothetical protein
MARNDGFGAECRIECSCKGIVSLKIYDIRYIFRERDLVGPPCCTKNDVSRHFFAAFPAGGVLERASYVWETRSYRRAAFANRNDSLRLVIIKVEAADIPAELSYELVER